MYRKNKSINRLKNLKYRNIYIKIDRNRMLDIVIHYSYVWNLSQARVSSSRKPLSLCVDLSSTGVANGLCREQKEHKKQAGGEVWRRID
jgi:hypothetical protein